jgi:hypothetical protein
MLLLRQDLKPSFRVSSVKGRRSEKRSSFRRLLPVIALVTVAAGIIYVIALAGPLIWTYVEGAVVSDPGLGATIFNAIVLFAFLSSIMVSATTVGNSAKMEYILVMPVSMRTIFLEKTVLVILSNCILWLTIGVPIFVGFSFVSTARFALLSAPVFVGMALMLVCLGVSLGGLVGLVFTRLLAGRRALKQVGYFLLSGGAIIFSAFWYYSFYFGNSGGPLFGWLVTFARSIGFSSNLSPGYAASVISLGLLAGLPLRIQDVFLALAFVLISVALLDANSILSERAHYSGWLAIGSKRSSKKFISIVHTPWAPKSIPLVGSNSTISVSIWYNITSIRREARVMANYLLRPITYVIWILLPTFAVGQETPVFTPYLLVLALIPFATQYGLFFAGYEIVYEGKNLMNLQLAAANMEDYVKGKVYSAVPFTLVASIIFSVVIAFLSPPMLIYLPAITISCLFLTLASGAVAANAAAIGGDFKAARMILRQRGSAVQMPIRGWSMLRAGLMPYILGYGGVFLMLALGTFFNPLYSYLVLPVFSVVCLQVLRSYAHGAGMKLAQIEATKYL